MFIQEIGISVLNLDIPCYIFLKKSLEIQKSVNLYVENEE